MTDAGLAHLKSLTTLQALNLFSCPQVTDAGLAHLKRLTALQVLNLEHCYQVTHAGLAYLRKYLPQCRIAHSLDRRERGRR